MEAEPVGKIAGQTGLVGASGTTVKVGHTAWRGFFRIPDRRFYLAVFALVISQ